MTTNRRRVNRDNAEQMLRGAAVGRLYDRDPLSGRLLAAAAPAFADEFAGEREALAAFRLTAHTSPVPPLRRRSMIKTALAKVLTLKAAAVLAAVSAGGVALAASTGALPNPLDHRSSAPAPAHATAKPTPGPVNAHGSPSPSLVGLCHAFVAGAGADHGKALENPAFKVLITAAGGKDNVDAYCAGVLTSPGASTEAEPESDHPTGTPHPTGAPTPHPTGPETTHGAS